MVGKHLVRRTLQLTLIALLVATIALAGLPGNPHPRASANVPAGEQATQAASAAPGNWILKAQEGCLDLVLQGLEQMVETGFIILKQMRDYVLVSFPPALDTAIDLLKGLAGVQWVEPDSRVSAAVTPNDPNYAQQWNLQRINMPQAWDMLPVGDPSVIVSVLDSGVAFEDRDVFRQAPDLAGVQFLPGYDFVSSDLYPDDEYWHGTFVTELICSGWNNGIRAAGIASGCTIMPLRVLDSRGEGNLFDVASAIDYAVDNGARIINLSLAASPGAADSNTLSEAVDYAASRGVLCIAAAGNLSGPVELPARLPSVLAVGATDVNNALAPYSNTGPEIDLVAPGGYGSNFVVQESFTTEGKPSSGFVLRQATGTSFACAQVTGVAALMLSANPDLQAADLVTLLTSTCEDLGPLGRDSSYGAGLLNAAAAMDDAGNRIWYFAEGSTRPGFQEWLCLLNSGSSPASAAITYFYIDGAWVNDTVNVPAGTRLTIPVNSVLGEGWDVSIRVICSSRDLLCERPMYFNYEGKWSGGTAATGSPRRSQLWLFSEGYTGSGFEEWLCLANPGGAWANVTVDYIYGSGPPQWGTYSLPPFSRRTIYVNGQVGAGREVSMRVEADQPIVAERPMYFLYGGHIDGGHNVLGATATSNTWFFAEGTTRSGFDEYLTILNTGNTAADVAVYYLLGPGQGDAQQKYYPVRAHSRLTINVRDEVGSGKDVSCFIQSNQPIVAERPMYFLYGSWSGGHDVTGANYASDTWLFAEGTTRAGFEEWLTLANPNPQSASVTIEYFLGYGQGSSIQRQYSVAAGSRATIYVPSEVGREKDVSAAVHASLPIVAERPIYFRYGTWDGGSDVLGFPGL